MRSKRVTTFSIPVITLQTKQYLKNLLIIAVLLLGVAACSDRKEDYDNSPEKVSINLPNIPGGNGAAWPPQTSCIRCPPISYHQARCLFEDWWPDCVQTGTVTWNPALIINDSNAAGTSNPDLDMAFAHDFMDNYLWAFDKGVQYIEYYEQIGLAISENGGISLLDIPAHYNFAKATYAVADSIRNGQPSCVPISTQYKSDALAMIAYWRIRCSQSIFQSSLDSITADLNTFTGLTRAQIYGHFE